MIALALASAATGEYTMNRSSFDGGGLTKSSGGRYELGATVGQCDAETLTGNTYELSGGFWFPVSAGDCDTDGMVNLFDYGSFEDCLSGPESDPPAGACRCFDLDDSGAVDLGDFARLQLQFAGP